MNSHAIDCPLASEHARRRALADAVRADDLDRAIAIGLFADVAIAERDGIDTDAVCAQCRDDDRLVAHARDERLRALAARDRYRRREARLRERKQRRGETRASAAPSPQAVAAASPSALPAAAAAALARAKAKAAKRGDSA